QRPRVSMRGDAEYRFGTRNICSQCGPCLRVRIAQQRIHGIPCRRRLPVTACSWRSLFPDPCLETTDRRYWPERQTTSATGVLNILMEAERERNACSKD